MMTPSLYVTRSGVVGDGVQAKLRLEMGQERLRQQHAKELEEKELDLESIKASTQKKVCIFMLSHFGVRILSVVTYLPCYNISIGSAMFGWEGNRRSEQCQSTGLVTPPRYSQPFPSPSLPLITARGSGRSL